MSDRYRKPLKFAVTATSEFVKHDWQGEVSVRWSLTGAGWIAHHHELRVASAYCVTPESAVRDMLKRNGYLVVNLTLRQ